MEWFTSFDFKRLSICLLYSLFNTSVTISISCSISSGNSCASIFYKINSCYEHCWCILQANDKLKRAKVDKIAHMLALDEHVTGK